MTVTIVNHEGREVPSTEPATCAVCGVEGLRGDFPGQGGIVHDPRRPDGASTCDDCAEEWERAAGRTWEHPEAAR